MQKTCTYSSLEWKHQVRLQKKTAESVEFERRMDGWEKLREHLKEDASVRSKKIKIKEFLMTLRSPTEDVQHLMSILVNSEIKADLPAEASEDERINEVLELPISERFIFSEDITELECYRCDRTYRRIHSLALHMEKMHQITLCRKCVVEGGADHICSEQETPERTQI